MSRLGKKAIIIPAGTDVSVVDGVLSVKGKGGALVRSVHPSVAVTIEGTSVTVSPAKNTRLARALWGTYAAHVRNMVAGVSTPFSKKLKVEGIGYRSEVSGKTLTLTVGFSHPVKTEIPEDLAVTAEKNVITISGIDRDRVGQFAASVRAIKKPEPYKGKGIRYVDEVVRMKEGKKSSS
jgi:large subunit ribosomal protein L6